MQGHRLTCLPTPISALIHPFVSVCPCPPPCAGGASSHTTAQQGETYIRPEAQRNHSADMLMRFLPAHQSMRLSGTGFKKMTTCIDTAPQWQCKHKKWLLQMSSQFQNASAHLEQTSAAVCSKQDSVIQNRCRTTNNLICLVAQDARQRRFMFVKKAEINTVHGKKRIESCRWCNTNIINTLQL